MEAICISSSIANFRKKLFDRTKLPEWKWWQWNKSVVFFGCYHAGDYWKILWHRGKKSIFFCGSDILQLEKSNWGRIIPSVRATFYCENEVEQERLRRMRIKAEVYPMIFDQPEDIEVCFKPSEKPQVYLTCHPGSQEKYGIDYVEGIAASVPDIRFHIYGINGSSHDNVYYHGLVSNQRFNQDIKHYQACCRLNEFDGFGEALAKSVLMGQYPISLINYPMIDFAPDATRFIRLLNNLKKKTEPNYKAAKYWSDKLENSLCQILRR